MRLEVVEDGAVTDVAVVGELDAMGARRLRELLLGTINDPSVEVVRLDLAGVTFLDSTGLGALVHAKRAAVTRGVELAVVATSERVQQLLDITGLSKVLDVTPTT